MEEGEFLLKKMINSIKIIRNITMENYLKDPSGSLQDQLKIFLICGIAIIWRISSLKLYELLL